MGKKKGGNYMIYIKKRRGGKVVNLVLTSQATFYYPLVDCIGAIKQNYF